MQKDWGKAFDVISWNEDGLNFSNSVCCACYLSKTLAWCVPREKNLQWFGSTYILYVRYIILSGESREKRNHKEERQKLTFRRQKHAMKHLKRKKKKRTESKKHRSSVCRISTKTTQAHPDCLDNAMNWIVIYYLAVLFNRPKIFLKRPSSSFANSF